LAAFYLSSCGRREALEGFELDLQGGDSMGALSFGQGHEGREAGIDGVLDFGAGGFAAFNPSDS
jgi:hypothetical protein